MMAQIPRWLADLLCAVWIACAGIAFVVVSSMIMSGDRQNALQALELVAIGRYVYVVGLTLVLAGAAIGIMRRLRR